MPFSLAARAYAHNPQRAVLALALLAAGVGELQSASTASLAAR